jgi:hypothetical protein
MRRFAIVGVTALLVFGLATVADAVKPPRLADEAMAIEQAWTAWLLGDGSAPPLADDFCGEIVDGRFFLTITFTGVAEIDCQIPAGVEAVASPFGAIAWSPTDGKNGTKLFHSALGYLDGAIPKSVSVAVDGATLPREPMICSDAFQITLEPGNALQQIDPNVTGDSSKAVTCGWFTLVGPLSAGQHTVDVTGQSKGSPPFQIRYNVTVG